MMLIFFSFFHFERTYIKRWAFCKKNNDTICYNYDNRNIFQIHYVSVTLATKKKIKEEEIYNIIVSEIPVDKSNS